MSLTALLDDRIPVSLLTGFLGSGKTTVLNRLLKHPALAGAAVIINEFGEVAIDHHLVEAIAENLAVLQNGCLCCTVRDDLMETLANLHAQSGRGEIPPFDRVVIETTGLADPVPIIATLLADPVLYGLFRLDSIVTTVDASTAMATLAAQEESVKQVAVADRILLTKTDLVSPAALRTLEERIGGINPGAPILRAYNGVVDPARLFDVGLYDPSTKSAQVQDWLNAESFPSADDLGEPAARRRRSSRHDERIRSVSLVVDDPIPMRIFDTWLDTLMTMLGPDLLRMKGLVHVEDIQSPFVIHAVQHIFHPPVLLDAWPSQDRRTRIVLIGRDMSTKLIEQSLAFLRGTASRKRPGAVALPGLGATGYKGASRGG